MSRLAFKESGSTPRTIDTTDEDPTAGSVGGTSIGLILILLITSAGVLIASVSYITANAVPVTILTSGYFTTHELRIAFNHRYHKALVGSPHDVNTFLNIVHPLEDSYNSMVTLSKFSIFGWNLSYPFIEWFIAEFKDLIYTLLKFLFGPGVRPILEQVLSMATEGMIIVVNLASELLSGLTTGSANVGASQEVGANPFTGSSSFIVRIFLVSGKFVVRFLLIFQDQAEKFIEFIGNIVLKYGAVLVKALTQILSIISPSGPLGKLIGSLLDMQCKITQFLTSSCQTQKLAAKELCIAEDTVAGAYNYIRGIVSNLCGGCHVGPKLDGCNVNDKKFTCHSPKCSSSFSLGLGICDEAECAADTKNIIAGLVSLQWSCSTWQSTNAQLECMKYTRDYSNNNSTSTSKQPIETIGGELCLVVREHILVSCASYSTPFQFDQNEVVFQVCTEDLSNSTVSFQGSCACIYTTPLCDQSCCNQYGLHIYNQVYAQLGHRTLGNIQNTFPRAIFCPLATSTSANITAFDDYTYLHALCNLYDQVLGPLLLLESHLLRLEDVNIASFRDRFINDTCTRTVSQIGVCQTINQTVDSTLINLQNMRSILSESTLFGLNADSSYTGFGIVTTPTVDTPITLLPILNVEKYYCQYYSLEKNNSNVKYRFNDWDLDAMVSPFCDQAITAVYLSLNLQRYVTAGNTKNLDGVTVNTSLAGLPPDLDVFGASQAPSAQSPDCLYDADVSTQQACAANQQEELNNIGTEVNDVGSETLDSLATNAQTSSSVSHLGGAVDPSDPQYAQKQNETDILNNAQNFPTDAPPLVTSTIKDQTSPIPTDFRPAVPDGDPLDHLAFRPATGTTLRTLFSLDDAEKRKNNKRLDDFVASVEDTRVRLTEAISKLRNQIKSMSIWRDDSEENRLRDRIFSERRARRGQERMKRLLALHQVEYEHASTNNISIDSPEYMPRTRKLMGIADGFNSSAQELGIINSVLLGIGRSAPIPADMDEYITTLGISQNDFDNFLSEQAYTSMLNMVNALNDKFFPMLYRKFYEMDTTAGVGGGGGDYSLFGSDFQNTIGKNITTPRCINHVAHPLECCTFGTTSYECCYGLDFCIPDPPDWIYATRTTKDTVRKWECSKFDSLLKENWQAIRIFSSSISAILQWTPFSIVHAIDNVTFGAIAYSEGTYPHNALGCAFVYQEYIYALILLLIVITIFMTSGLFLEVFIYMNTNNENIARDHKIRDLERRLQMLESNLTFKTL